MQGIGSFLAPDNALGWTVVDILSLLLAAAIFLLVKRRSLQFPAWFQTIAIHPWYSAGLLFALPIALRLFLLVRYPQPVPSGADDFGYLLLADTLRHGRLANPSLPLPAFFEQIFVLQAPAYASMFPLGQGMALAIGWLALGTPWAGVLVAGGCFCATLYWFLRGWTTPAWALTGGLLGVMQFGPLCYWTNCYWGGFVSAIAGCLVFGALPRIQACPRTRDVLLLGFGLALQILTRQYEFFLMLVAIAFFLRRPMLKSALVLAPAVLLIGAQNRAVTGHWTTLPYSLYRYQYGIPATFTFQRNPVPHNDLNQEQALDYRTESAVHGEEPDSAPKFLKRLALRIRFYRFFLYAPLYLALASFLIFARGVRLVILPIATLIFILGSNFYPYFYPHYIAAVACLFVGMAIGGLQRMRAPAAAAILAACAVQFAVWYSLHLVGAAPGQYEAWDFLNGPDPGGRATIARQLGRQPGKQVVFVHYSPEHGLSEWIGNAADPSQATVMWVHDLGAEENRKLLQRYPDRHPWLMKPDEAPPALTRYGLPAGPFEDVQ